jgi:hypothetical protein
MLPAFDLLPGRQAFLGGNVAGLCKVSQEIQRKASPAPQLLQRFKAAFIVTVHLLPCGEQHYLYIIMSHPECALP